MTTGNFSEYAKHRGVAPAYVTKLRKQGRLVLVTVDGRELVDFEQSDRLVDNTADQGRALNGLNAKPAAEGPPAEESTTAPQGAAAIAGGGAAAPAPVGVDSIFRKAQAQERVFAAKSAELAYRKAARELVDRKAVERTVFDLFRALRDQAFQATTRAAALVAGMADVSEIERLMAEELRRSFDAWEKRATDRLEREAK